MLGSLLVLVMTRMPCLPVELGQIPTPPAEVPAPIVPPAATPPPPPPPPRAIPHPVAAAERTRYEVHYGPLTIGEVQLDISGAGPGAAFVAAAGRGAGGLLGLGRMENRVTTEFDLERLDSRRWDDARSGGDRPLNDHVDRAQPGQVSFVRELAASPGALLKSVATLPGPLLDPVGFLLRVRVGAPPARARAAPHIL
jgi:hypothetical protein